MRTTALAFLFSIAACAPRDEAPPSAPSAPASSSPAALPATSEPPPSTTGIASARAADGPPVSDAEPVIRAQIHPGAKRCYQRGLEVDPTQAGRIVILLLIGPGGDVDASSVAANSGLSASVAECIADVAAHAHFPPPGAQGAKMSIPFNFKRAGADGGA